MRDYFYRLIARYIGLYVRPQDPVALICHPSEPLRKWFPQAEDWGVSIREDVEAPPYIVISGCLHHESDIQSFLERLRRRCRPSTRVIVTYYSSLWRPALSLANRLRWRSKEPEQNWLAPEDMENLLRLSDFETVKTDSKIICPVYIPLISGLLNRFVAPLPIFRNLAMVNLVVARPSEAPRALAARPSVSVVVPARNEAGNIENAIRRLPAMGPDDELIFVEGNSTDDTWEKIQEAQRKYGGERTIIIAQQGGKGKGDAVRKGFSLASKEILMILDADLTVPPEDLPKFYRALVREKGEFINGSRLVYPMEGQAMRFLNMMGNKFFALAFSFVLGQRFKDTLCGTKVLSREHYLKLTEHRSYFGDFDPFGDFDLIFGASRLGLKIVEVPIAYRDRVYGATNISRWSHGLLLLRMLVFASLRLRFI
jgi:GT2 family glycosyltransferase